MTFSDNAKVVKLKYESTYYIAVFNLKMYVDCLNISHDKLRLISYLPCQLTNFGGQGCQSI